MPLSSTRCLVASLLSLAFLIPGCDEPPAVVGTSGVPTRTSQSGDQMELKKRQMAFINRIRSADPQAQTIDRAMLNEQNELGLVLDRSVEMDKVSALMRAMLTQIQLARPAQRLSRSEPL